MKTGLVWLFHPATPKVEKVEMYEAETQAELQSMLYTQVQMQLQRQRQRTKITIHGQEPPITALSWGSGWMRPPSQGLPEQRLWDSAHTRASHFGT
eukprot:g9016.t1